MDRYPGVVQDSVPRDNCDAEFHEAMLHPRIRPLPSVFLLGAARCGTTTLSAMIGQLPQVCFSQPKEPWFFEVEFELGLAHYMSRYFAHWNGEALLAEGRHRNLYLPWVPGRIHATNPNARLIVVCRNPIDRAYSNWWYACNHGMETEEFEVAIRLDHERIQQGLCLSAADEIARYHAAMDHNRRLTSTGEGIYRTYLDSGYYVSQIDRYLRLFPRENLLVLLFDDLVSDPGRTLNRVAEHIGVGLASADSADIGIHLEAKRGLTPRWLRILSANACLRRALPYCPRFVRHSLRRIRDRGASWPKMNPRTRGWLQDHFRPHVTSLQDFLNRDLSHWK